MRVLVVNESYQHRGGEDVAVDADVAILREHGHSVQRWVVDNAEIAQWSALRKSSLLWRTTWSVKSYRQMRSLTTDFRPDVVHFHNTLPLISPSAIVAAHRLGLPVVMTLHNYRLMCPVGTFLREGKICEECHTRSLMRSIMHRCYRGSAVQTGALALMLQTHRMMGTWRTCVDAYVLLTEFMRAKMSEGGLPADRLHVRPTPVTTIGEQRSSPGSYIQFVGRLSHEKGIDTLIEMAGLVRPSVVRIAGDGPMKETVTEAARASDHRIQYQGELAHDAALESLSGAGVVVFPSICYEGLSVVLLEALSSGVPVVASRIGAVPEIIDDGVEGFLVEPGNAAELARSVRKVLSDAQLRQSMGAAALRRHHAQFSRASCYSRLIEIYESAIHSRVRRAVPREQA